MTMCAYEDALVMKPLVDALVAQCREGEYVIFRQPFRWMRGTWDDHSVMPNAYEMFELEQVMSERGLEARYTFEHAAIITPARAQGQQNEGAESSSQDQGEKK